jgi:hypothetical protein
MSEFFTGINNRYYTSVLLDDRVIRRPAGMFPNGMFPFIL